VFEKQPHRHWLMLVLITLKSQPLKKASQIIWKALLYLNLDYLIF